jgi:beta-barrel assembly-enhancing protease
MWRGTGIRILVRIMRLLLAALAVQYFVNGVADLRVIAVQSPQERQREATMLWARWIQAGLLVAVMVSTGAPCAWARFQVPPPCNNAFTIDQEIAEGRQIAAQVFREMPVLPDNSQVSQYVRRLGMSLVPHAPGHRWPYAFHVVASEDINAFAVPGGSIFINLGLVRATETEAQLAGVVAHEISHVALRHSTCNLTRSQAPRAGFGIASALSSVLLGGSTWGSIAQTGIGIGATAVFTSMSREFERQADLLGVGILHDAGFDPRGMAQFFEIIQARYGQRGAQWLSSHPNPGNRMEYTNAEIATLPPLRNPRVTSAEFTRIRGVAMNQRVHSAREIQAGAWRGTGRYALRAGGPAQVIPPPSAGGQGGSVARLSRSFLGVNDRMVPYEGKGFVVSYPASWKKENSQNGSAAFAPPNSTGQAAIAYGVVIDGARWQGGVRDASSLAQATNALARELSEANGGFQQASQPTAITVSGRPANSVELRGRSAVSDQGTQLAERGWLVTVARPDGDMNYLAFVAPEPDFATLKPVFEAMLQSFRVR